MNGPTKSRAKSRARDDADVRRHPGAGDRDEPRRDRDRLGDDGGGAERAPRHGAPRRISGSAAVEHAKSHLMQFTGQPIEAVSSLNRTREGWRVVLEVLELERIPRTTDILASYAVELDERGDLMGYERIHRYYRNDVSGDQ